MCFSPQRRAIFRHCNFEKCSENVVFCTFSLENVLLATAACNFPINFKKWSEAETPQRRAIFQHLNFKKWSGADVFCTFSLENVLLATAACNFSTSQLQKVLRTPQFFRILTSKCASRHSGVQFFISPLTK